LDFSWKIRPVFVLFSVPLEPPKIALENKDSVLDSILNNKLLNVLRTPISEIVLLDGLSELSSEN
jgi:hypothetical protein